MPERKWEPAPFDWRWVHIDDGRPFRLKTNGTDAMIVGKRVPLAQLFPGASIRVEMS